MSLAYFARNAASAERLRARMLRTGYTIFGQKLWTEEEDWLCRLFHPDYFALRQILYTRSERAIKARCRTLGLARRHRSWGPLDKQKLRKLYPGATKAELLEAFPGASWTSIQSAARYYGYRRKKRPYKITGVVALDQIRSYCYDTHRTMRDADEDAGTKRYFQTRGYRTTYPNFRAIHRFVKALGGHLEVMWDE